ncbi:MAG: sigma-70 family RNA polymerase sigma factor [Phycisphaerae bacterium]|nr:sigma-70 family RNA polymerase sigma factor [Phycisphaerae bacterium]
MDQWQAWFHQHGPALILFARQHVRSHAEAEDVVQDGFIRFWRRRSGVQDPLAFLYRCVRTVAIDLERTEGRRRTREREAGSRSTQAMFQSPLERAESDAAVQQALETLPLEQKEVVALKLWGEMTFAQVAEALEISPNTAASRYRYAITALRRELAEESVR